MSDNIRKRMQDITLGLTDAPISLPSSVCVQAARANRFAIVGTLVNPRKQNMRALIGNLPRVWGMEDTVVGRIVDTRKFQFVFNSEESLNLVLKRGPWSFSEWMLVTHKWIPNMPEATMKIIPFWTQIHGIPPQYLTLAMIGVIGRSLGHVSAIDFDENGSRVDYVRVRLDWNIVNPLCFKREFQFGHNESAILSFYYERLRNFCKICGMITHEKKECPLRFDVGDENDDFPDEDNNENAEDGNDQTDDGNAPALDTNSGDVKHAAGDHFAGETETRSLNNVRSQKMMFDSTMVASPSMSVPLSEKSFSLIIDNDLNAETRRYLQAKMAKGKFTDEEIYNLMTNKMKTEGLSESHKRQRDENGVKKETQETSTMSFNKTKIPGLMSPIHENGVSLEEKFPNLLQGLDYLKTLTEEERPNMINWFKESLKRTENVDSYGEYATLGDDVTQSKQRRIDVEEWLNNAFPGKEDRMDLFPFQDDSPESSMGSFEVVQRIDGGAGGPIPPPVP